MTTASYWIGGLGNWSTAANWQGGVPNTNVIAVIEDTASGGQIGVGWGYPVYVASLLIASSQAEVYDQGSLYIARGGTLAVSSGVFNLPVGGSVIGGTLQATPGAGFFYWEGGTLINVTFEGVLDLSDARPAYTRRLVVENLLPANQPGYNLPILLTGAGSSLTFLGTQTLSDATVTLGASGGLTSNSPQLVFDAVNYSGTLTVAATSSINVEGAGEISTNLSRQLVAIVDRGQTSLADGATLLVDAHFVNYGAFSLNSTGDTTTLELAGGPFANRGAITLSDNPANVIEDQPGATTPVAFQNLAKLSGAGLIGVGDGMLQLVNSGVIDANGANALEIDTGAQEVNQGLLEAAGAGGLVLDDYIINTGGHIEALTGSQIQLFGGEIYGGSVSLASDAMLFSTVGTGTLDGGAAVTGGQIEAFEAGVIAFGTTKISGAILTTDTGGALTTTTSGGATTFQNVTLTSGTEFVQNNDDVLHLAGTITLASDSGLPATIVTGNCFGWGNTPGLFWTTGVDVSGQTILAGGGVLMLGDSTYGGQIFADAGGTLVNRDTIVGAGQIGVKTSELAVFDEGLNRTSPQSTNTPTALALTNQGVIDAVDGALSIAVKGTINNNGGLLESTDGGQLLIDNAVNGGAISIGAASEVHLSGNAVKTAVSFDDSLGDNGTLYVSSASYLRQSSISGFYADGLGNSDAIIVGTAWPASPPTWTFSENAAGTAGTLTVQSAANITLANLLLDGQYLDASTTATSATSSLFTLSESAYGTLRITTSALEQAASPTPVT